MATGPKMGPILPPPTRTVKDADTFADDKVGADKAKREQTKKAAEEGAKKSRSAELAKKVEQAQAAQFADGRDDTGKAKRVDQGRESKGPQLKPGQQGGREAPSVERNLGKAAQELGSIASLLQQLGDVIGDADEIVDGSFLDDKLGAEMARRKEANKRGAADRSKQASKDKIARQAEQTAASGDAEGEESREGLKTRAPEGDGVKETPLQSRGDGLLEDGAARTDAKTTARNLPEMLRQVEEQAARLLELGDMLGKQMEVEGKVSDLQDCADLIKKAHNNLKGLLLPVLTGELGAIKKDRYVQFKGLFDAASDWPATVPPGHGCTGPDAWSDGDWNSFLSWLFLPEGMPDDVKSQWDF